MTGQNIERCRLSFLQLIDRAITGEVKAQTALVETARNLSIGVRRGLPSARIVASTLGESTTLMGALSLVLSGKFALAPAA